MLGTVAVVMSCVACQQEPVQVTLDFPSVETFIHSEIARLQVYPLSSQDQLQACPRLILDSINLSPPWSPVHDTGDLPVCSFYLGAAAIEDVDAGPKAFVVVVRDNVSQALLAGCTIAEVFSDGPDIEVTLFMTDQYEAATRDRVAACTEIADKCLRGCQ